jgi:hypothetical protein
MTTCLSLAKQVLIKYIDSAEIDVWKLNSTVNSEVGVKGDIKYCPELRKSTSIRDKFKITYFEDIELYFTKIKIGTGSKHIYKKGDFMKEHYDTRHDDLDGLPHIMTLIVTDDTDNLKINGKIIKKPYSRYSSYSCVFFTLNCLHEVTEIKSDIVRQSFVFPIYGKYDFHTATFHSLKSVNISNKYDTIINVLQDRIKNNDYSEIKYLHGHLKICEYDLLNNWLKPLDEFEYEENNIIRPYYEITYELLDGTKMEKIISSTLEIADVKNIKIQPIDYHKTIFLNIVNKLVEYRDENLEIYNTFVNTELNDYTISKLTKDINELEEYPYVIVLMGRYFTDSNINDLISIDKYVYDLLKNKNVKYLPSATIDSNIIKSYPMLFVTLEGLKKNNENKIEDVNISDLEIEFDDGSEYDPSYKLIKAVLIIE